MQLKKFKLKKALVIWFLRVVRQLGRLASFVHMKSPRIRRNSKQLKLSHSRRVQVCSLICKIVSELLVRVESSRFLVQQPRRRYFFLYNQEFMQINNNNEQTKKRLCWRQQTTLITYQQAMPPKGPVPCFFLLWVFEHVSQLGSHNKWPEDGGN